MPNNSKEQCTVLAENVGEFSTERVIRIGNDFFHQKANGGERGAWQNGGPKGAFGTRIVTRAEARAVMLSLGCEPCRARDLTQDEGRDDDVR